MYLQGLCGFGHCGHFVLVESHTTWSFVTEFFHLAAFSKFTHVVVCVSTAFLLTTKYHPIVWLNHVWFIPYQLNDILGCFHFVALINNAVLNTHKQGSCVVICFHISWAELLRRRIAGLTLCLTSKNGPTVFPGGCTDL